jgi:hypothetical protein
MLTELDEVDRGSSRRCRPTAGAPTRGSARSSGCRRAGCATAWAGSSSRASSRSWGSPTRCGSASTSWRSSACRPEAGRIREVSQRLAELPEASYVAVTAGRFDCIVEVICRDSAHFGELLTDRLNGLEGA